MDEVVSQHEAEAGLDAAERKAFKVWDVILCPDRGVRRVGAAF